MLEEVVVIVWVEERLDSIWTWTVAMETYFAESEKIVNNSHLHQ